MSNFKKELGKILTHWDTNQAIGRQQAFAQIVELIEKEIIGVDEFHHQGVPKFYRNKLRAEQREKVK